MDFQKTNSKNSKSDANSVRTFSFKGLTDQTEKNSVYSFTEKTAKNSLGNSVSMTGDSAAIEVCNADNKAFKQVSMSSGIHTPAGKDAIGETYYLHGGPYISGPGIYRMDAYLKIGSGKWQLINRMTGITITP